jgi:hypothetical protein
MTQELTREQIMKASVHMHAEKKKYVHEVWLNRQAEYQKMKEQDCYGYKGAKVQNVGRACTRGSQAR